MSGRKYERVSFKKGTDEDSTADDEFSSYDGSASVNTGQISSESRISQLQRQKREALALKSNRRSNQANQGFYSAKDLYEVSAGDLLAIDETDDFAEEYDPLINYHIDLSGENEHLSTNTSMQMSTGRIDRLYSKGEQEMLLGILSTNEQRKQVTKTVFDPLKRTHGVEEILKYAKENMSELQSYDGFEEEALQSFAGRTTSQGGSLQSVSVSSQHRLLS